MAFDKKLKIEMLIDEKYVGTLVLTKKMFKEIGGEVDKTNKHLEEQKRNLKLIEDQLKRVGAAGDSHTRTWGKFAIVANQTLELFRKMAFFAEKLAVPLQESGQFEQYKTTLRNLIGDIDSADFRFRQMVDFAAKTPFTVPGVVEAGNQLQALGRFSLDTIRMLGDLAAASGRDVSMAVEAYTNLVTGRTGMAVRQFRMMLISNADWVKETGKQVLKNASGAKATITEMLEALPKIIAKKNFTGMMEAQNKTLFGQLSNLKDIWQQFMAETGDVFLEPIKNAVTWLSKVGIPWLKENVQQLLGVFRELLRVLAGFVIVKTITTTYTALGVAIVAFATPLSKVNLLLKASTVATSGLNKALVTLIATIKVHPYMAAALAIASLVYAYKAYQRATAETIYTQKAHTDATLSSNKMMLEAIETKYKDDEATKDLITRYNELKNKVNKTAEETEEFGKVQNALRNKYPELINKQNDFIDTFGRLDSELKRVTASTSEYSNKIKGMKTEIEDLIKKAAVLETKIAQDKLSSTLGDSANFENKDFVDRSILKFTHLLGLKDKGKEEADKFFKGFFEGIDKAKTGTELQAANVKLLNAIHGVGANKFLGQKISIESINKMLNMAKDVVDSKLKELDVEAGRSTDAIVGKLDRIFKNKNIGSDNIKQAQASLKWLQENKDKFETNGIFDFEGEHFEVTSKGMRDGAKNSFDQKIRLMEEYIADMDKSTIDAEKEGNKLRKKAFEDLRNDEIAIEEEFKQNKIDIIEDLTTTESEKIKLLTAEYDRYNKKLTDFDNTRVKAFYDTHSDLSSSESKFQTKVQKTIATFTAQQVEDYDKLYQKQNSVFDGLKSFWDNSTVANEEEIKYLQEKLGLYDSMIKEANALGTMAHPDVYEARAKVYSALKVAIDDRDAKNLFHLTVGFKFDSADFKLPKEFTQAGKTFELLNAEIDSAEESLNAWYEDRASATRDRYKGALTETDWEKDAIRNRKLKQVEYDRLVAMEKLYLEKIKALSKVTTEENEKDANGNLTTKALGARIAREKALAKAKSDLLKTQADKSDTKQEIDKDEIETDRKKLETKLRLYQKFADAIGEILGNITQMQSESVKKELEEWKKSQFERLSYEEESANKMARTEAQKERIKAYYERQRQKIEKKAEEEYKKRMRTMFYLEKAANIAKAISATALAVTEALPNIPLSVFVGAMGAAQVATIASQELPQMATGGVVGYDNQTGKSQRGKVRGVGTGTDDRILTALSNGEYVMDAKNTAKYISILEMMRAGKYDVDGMARGGIMGININRDISLREMARRNDTALAYEMKSTRTVLEKYLSNPPVPELVVGDEHILKIMRRGMELLRKSNL